VSCPNCGDEFEPRAGIPVLLSLADRESPILLAYRDLYDQIAQDDLSRAIQGSEYLDAQGDLLIHEIGGLASLDVCDVGVGQGRMFERLAEEGPKSLVGVDIAWPYLERYRGTERTLIMANAENLPYRDEFDLLISTDVMEHVLNLGDFLVSALEALRPGGLAVLRAPLTEDLTMYAARRGGKYRFVHLRTFTKSEMTRQIEAAGFEVERTFTRGWWLSRRRSWVAASPRVEALVNRVVLARFGAHERVNTMNPRLARLIMRPNEITVFARRPAGP
jgi:2-polyprenyl-3-methyl-5-hydroxy-6-metoxy-1,4-benzoquinol methylase